MYGVTPQGGRLRFRVLRQDFASQHFARVANSQGGAFVFVFFARVSPASPASRQGLATPPPHRPTCLRRDVRT